MPEPTASLGTPPAPSLFAPPGVPAGWYFSAEDLLRLTVYNSAAGVAVQLRGRFLALGERTARDLVRDLTPATDRSASTLTIPMEEGWLLDAQIVVSAGTPKRGQTFARLSMVRGNASSGYDISLIAANYVTAGERASYPNSLLVGPLDGPGCLRSITGANPAAGAQISETVPTGARWRFWAMNGSLLTDANAATRETVLLFDDGTTVFAEYPATQTQITGLTRRYQWSKAKAFAVLNQYATMPVETPELMLLAGYRIRTLIQNGQVGDDWGAPQYLVEEWIEP